MRELTQVANLPESPFPGIQPFEYQHRQVFFARDQEARTLSRLIVMYRGALVFSGSGTGKSSLLNAGLIPKAIEEGFRPERVRVQPKPGEEIIIERIPLDAEETFSLPAVEPPSDLRLVMSVEAFAAEVRQNRGGPCPLLIFDQFEEWVTLFEEGRAGVSTDTLRDSQQRIADMIVSLLDDTALPVKVLISLREDYLASISPILERCPSLADQYLRLMPLRSDQLDRIIRGPFETFPAVYQPELTAGVSDAIRREFEQRVAGGDIRLTEVQIVCRTLFEKGKQGGSVEEIFRDLGGVQGILEHYLQTSLENLPEGQLDPAIALLSRMVTSAGTRNVISEDDLISRVENEDHIDRQVLRDALVSIEANTRLVRREPRRGVHYYEIASEFLVDWIRRKSREREERATTQRLEQRRLAAEREAERLASEARRFEGLWRVSYARELAAAAVASLDIDPERSLLLALHAASLGHTGTEGVPTEALDALHRALYASRVRLRLTSGAAVRSVAYSSDGMRLVTGGDGGEVTVWDAGCGRKVLSLAGHEAYVYGVAISEDGTRIASVDRSTVYVWDAETGKLLNKIQSPKSTCVALTRDGSRVAAGNSAGRARIWNAQTGALVRVAARHRGGIFAVAFSADGKYLATAGREPQAAIWDAVTGRLRRKLVGHEDTVGAIAFSPDGSRVATASQDTTARIWSTESGEQLMTCTGHTDTVTHVAFSPDGSRLASSSFDRTAKIWNAATGLCTLTLLGHVGAVFSVAYGADGVRLATGSLDGTTRVWNTVLAGEMLTITSYNKPFEGVAFGPDGRVLATARLSRGELWDVESGRRIAHLHGLRGFVRSLAFSPDGSKLATAGDESTATLWDAADGRLLATIPGETFGTVPEKSEIIDVAFAPHGQLLATAGTSTRIWEVANGTLLANLEGPRSTRVVFSRDGRRVAAVENGFAAVWDLASGKRIRVVASQPESEFFTGVAFDPVGERLATADRGGFGRVWEIATGKLLVKLTGHTGGLSDIAFSPNGRMLATASMDQTTRIWDAANGRQLVTLPGHSAEVRRLAFSPEGNRLATAGSDGTVRVYALDHQMLHNLARWRITRGLTRDECVQYLRESGVPGSVEALNLLVEGRQLAWGGDTAAAAEVLWKAVRLDATLDFDPEAEAKRLAVDCLMKCGRQLATTGLLDRAVACFARAEELRPRPAGDPAIEARRLLTDGLLSQAERMVENGDVTGAVAAFTRAQEIDSSLDIPADSWNTLCWFGSLHGRAADVAHACERAVELAPHNGAIRESRGLNRALVGNIDGAIEDMQFFVTWSPRVAQRAKRERWIRALRAGRKPFGRGELKRLLKED